MKRSPTMGWLPALALLTGCSLYSHTNVQGTTGEPAASKASFHIGEPRGRSEKTLMILALSGGGSRAAYWSSDVMLALEKVFETEGWNLLHEVDAISSVSGGSLPAAYYAISADSPTEAGRLPSGRVWDRATVRELMRKNYRGKWIGNWFWPVNVARYWFTAYDRSDIMAQTLADNLYDQSFIGWYLRYRDLNPERPNLIINATNGTADHFGLPFTFTSEQFQAMDSDLADYDIARAVMASAAFPGAFNYMTLKDYGNDRHYFHVFDGGNYDNLGLFSAMQVLASNAQRFDRAVVILIDSYIPGGGIDHHAYDGRGTLDFGVDLNFLDSFDTLLSVNRARILEIFSAYLDRTFGDRSVFYHLRFDEVGDEGLRQQLQTIKTDFQIAAENADAIDIATAQLIVPENACLRQIMRLMEDQDNPDRATICRWRSPPTTRGSP
ncbi:MAG: patatin-like phospholipase family protein [Methylothermaceae bacterium]|nr:patatin-like phospholipase family protein [Methylothermaceae bacterium]